MSLPGFARGTLKLVALVGGAVVTVVSLMALVGTQTDNGWARAGAAIGIAVIVPALLADRVLARLAPDKLAGVTTDVLALTYMAFALAFVGAAHATSGPLLVKEGARLEKSGRAWTSRLAYTLAGGRREVVAAPAVATTTPVVAPKPEPAPVAKAEPTPAPAPPRAGDGKERTPAQIFSEFAPAVVTITVKHGFMGEGGGTGFVIDADGTIATNNHVVEGAESIEIKLMDGTILEEVEVLTTNEAIDLALLHAKPKAPLPTVVLGDSDKITVGERAVSIGNPLGLDHTLTDGLVSARRVIASRKMIQMSVPVSPGNSGGPLFNSRGEVIGVSTAIYSGGSPLAQNLNLAMPINDLKTLIKTEYPGRHKPGQSATSERW